MRSIFLLTFPLLVKEMTANLQCCTVKFPVWTSWGPCTVHSVNLRSEGAVQCCLTYSFCTVKRARGRISPPPTVCGLRHAFPDFGIVYLHNIAGSELISLGWSDAGYIRTWNKQHGVLESYQRDNTLLPLTTMAQCANIIFPNIYQINAFSHAPHSMATLLTVFPSLSYFHLLSLSLPLSVFSLCFLIPFLLSSFLVAFCLSLSLAVVLRLLLVLVKFLKVINSVIKHCFLFLSPPPPPGGIRRPINAAGRDLLTNSKRRLWGGGGVGSMNPLKKDCAAI